MTNPLFPIPRSDWLMVHTCTRFKVADADQGSDDEGWRQAVDLAEVARDNTRCYLATPNRRDVGAFGVLDVVVLVPVDFVVREGDVMQVDTQDNLDPAHIGTWDIVEVRPNPAHVRVLCRRSPGGQIDT